MEAIPKLQAQESLTMAAAVAVGSGSLKKGKAKEIVSKWERAAGRNRGVVKGMKTTEVAAMHGIGVVAEGKHD